MIYFEPEDDEFNLLTDASEKTQTSCYKKIKWNAKQLEMFSELKKIKQNIWIQIYDVYLDKNKMVESIGFRLTPEGQFYHEYPSISFDKNGNIENDLQEELSFYKEEGAKTFNLVKNFYKVLIALQNKENNNFK